MLAIPQIAYAQEQDAITPTLYCLGSCSTEQTTATNTPSPDENASLSQMPSSTEPDTSATPFPQSTPCSKNRNSTATPGSKSKGKQHQKITEGFLRQFIQLLIKFILSLLQQLGIHSSIPGSAGNPCPTLTPIPSESTTVTPKEPSPTPLPTEMKTTPTPISSSSCTNPSHVIKMDPSNPQNGITIGKFYIAADTWNAANYQVSQTMYVCNYNNWYVVAKMNNNKGDGAVKTYPNVHEDFNNQKISSFKNITSSFAEGGPHVGIYEFAYDIWLNGVASNGSTELMIWNDNFGQTPSGSQQATFSDGGQTYKVFKAGGYIAFVDNANVTSGTINLLHFFNFVISKGWISQSSTLGQIDYGVELVSTNNASATFKVTNFSLNAN